MTKVTIKLDYVASLLVSYHILCCPTKRNKDYNPEVFAELGVTDVESREYHKLLRDLGLDKECDSDVKMKIASAAGGHSSLDEALNSINVQVPESVSDNLAVFENRFKRYFINIAGKYASRIPQVEAVANQHIDTIYSLGRTFTGQELKAPDNLEIRVIEGLNTSAFPSGDDVHYHSRQQVFEGKDRFLKILAHEAVGHKSVMHLVDVNSEIFGGWNYYVEEGYVKVITNRILSKIGVRLDLVPGSKTIELSYKVFDSIWDDDLRSRNFDEWYKKGLLEVKRQAKEKGIEIERR